MTIGALAYTSDRAKVMSASFPYFFTSLLFAIPRGRPYTPMEKLLLPFDIFVWLLLITVFSSGLITTVTLKLSSKSKANFVFGPKNRMPYLNMINVFFGGPIENLPRRNFARWLLIVWIWNTIVIRSIYLSGLFNVMQQQPRVSPITTIEGLIEENYTLYMPDSLRHTFDLMPKTHSL